MEKRNKVILAVLISLVFALPSQGAVVEGVEVLGSPGDMGPGGDEGPGGRDAAVVIDFDDLTAPCVFSDTVALSGEYEALGAVFSGPGPLDGGAVLDECSSFGVTGYSAPNFLAFNCNADYSGGGYAEGPERVDFTEPMMFVEFRAASASFVGSLIQISAYTAGDQMVDQNSLNLSSTGQWLSVSGPNITWVEITGPCVFILDDFGFSPMTTATAPASWSALKASYR
jgi:hypothetical protein